MIFCHLEVWLFSLSRAKDMCWHGLNYSCTFVVLRNLDAIIRVSNYVRLNPSLKRALARVIN